MNMVMEKNSLRKDEYVQIPDPNNVFLFRVTASFRTRADGSLVCHLACKDWKTLLANSAPIGSIDPRVSVHEMESRVLQLDFPNRL